MYFYESRDLGWYKITSEITQSDIENMKDFKKICLDDRFNYSLDFLPDTIEELFIGVYFNKPLNNLPKNLKKLEFEYSSIFDHPIDNLPIGLETLVLSGEFNQEINFLPSGLKELIFKNGYFNQEINNLPSNLFRLELGFRFNKPLNNLPSGLKYLKIPYWYTQSLANLPTNLSRIYIPMKNKKLLSYEIKKYKYKIEYYR